MGKVELRLQIDEELLAKAEAAGLSVEDFVEAGLRAALGSDNPREADNSRIVSSGVEERAAAWAAENADAIADHRRRIAEYGVFGDEFRRW